jgi:hypothetical protein
MIDFNVYNTAEQLSSEIADRGYSVTPKNNTLIGELVKLSDLTIEKEFNGNGANNTPNAYDIMSDEYIQELSKSVNSHVKFARSVVVPIVKTFAETLSEEVKKYEFNSAEDGFVVKFFSLPVDLLGMIRKDLSKTKIDYKPSVYLPVDKLPSFEFLNYVYDDNNTAFNEAVATWFSGIGQNLAMSFISDSSGYSLNEINHFNKCLVNYLLYRTINDKVDLDFGLSRSELKSKARELELYYAKELAYAIEVIEDKINNGVVVLDHEKTLINDELSYFIVLSKENFDTFVQGGGCLETIFGGIYANKINSRVTIKEALANLEVFNNSWNTVKFLHDAKNHNARLSVFKKVLLNVFETTLHGEKEDSVKDMIESEGQERYNTTVYKQFKEYIETLSFNSINDIYNIALKTVAMIMFYPTASYQLLNDMNELTTKDPNLDPREASLLASINYITDFFIGQLQFVKH